MGIFSKVKERVTRTLHDPSLRRRIKEGVKELKEDILDEINPRRNPVRFADRKARLKVEVEEMKNRVELYELKHKLQELQNKEKKYQQERVDYYFGLLGLPQKSINPFGSSIQGSSVKTSKGKKKTSSSPLSPPTGGLVGYQLIDPFASASAMPSPVYSPFTVVYHRRRGRPKKNEYYDPFRTLPLSGVFGVKRKLKKLPWQ